MLFAVYNALLFSFHQQNSFRFRYSLWNNYATRRSSFIRTGRKVTPSLTIYYFFLQDSFLISSAFTQLLQQTGVMNQLKQSGRPYTLFIPTNAALQSMGVSTDVNRLRQVNFLFLSRPKQN